jgi:hypothetical protein
MWLEDTGNIHFKLDKRFRRNIFSIGSFTIWESFRIVQYNDISSIDLIYRRGFGSEKYMDSKPFIYRLMNKLFYKEYRIYAKSSKFVKKYSFIKDIFPDIKRNEKLEKLGI